MDLRLTPPSAVTAHRSRGFTLIELMVTVALMAIIITLGVPSFIDILRSWQRDVATRSFLSHVQLARAEAIKASRQVIMCTSADGATCAGNDNWMQGWIVFVDDDFDSVLDPGETILATQAAMNGLDRMVASNNVSNYFFLPSGLMPANQSRLVVEALGSASVDQNVITISNTGRARVSKEAKGT